MTDPSALWAYFAVRNGKISLLDRTPTTLSSVDGLSAEERQDRTDCLALYRYRTDSGAIFMRIDDLCWFPVDGGSSVPVLLAAYLRDEGQDNG